MSVVIAIPTETDPDERRIAVVPEVVKKYRALGATVALRRGAGLRAHWRDADFGDVELVDGDAELYARADVILRVQPPTDADLARCREGAVLLGMLQPWSSKTRIDMLRERKITAFALELLPRITRSQSMDALSSQAAVAGYECALIAADHCPKFFPMLTFAAGTIRPAKVLVVGAGVAGLQAIATARRIGAMVEAYDVRPETKEQVESLGAKFVDTGVAAGGGGGYARELTAEEKARQTERLGKAVAQCDALITTAAVPGKPAPRIVSAAMIAAMKPGAVVVDMAADTGGNVEGTVPGEKVWVNDVLIVGPTHIQSRMPVHASEMYAKNLYNFVSPFIEDGRCELDWQDEVMAGACLTHAGELRHAGVRQALGL